MQGPQWTFTWSVCSIIDSHVVHRGSVGPKTVTTGVPNALAKWRGPVSFVISRLARRIKRPKAVLFTATRDRDKHHTSADAVCPRAADLPETIRRIAGGG